MKKLLLFLIVAIFFAGCEENKFFSNHDYILKNTPQEIKNLPIEESKYYELTDRSKDTVFKIKKVYDKNNSYIKVTFFNGKGEVTGSQKRNFIKLYDNFYLSKSYDEVDKKYVYSVLELENNIITIDINYHNINFKHSIFKSQNGYSYYLIKENEITNFKNFLIKNLKDNRYRPHYYLISEKKDELEEQALKEIYKNEKNLKNLSIKDKKAILIALNDYYAQYKYLNNNLKRDKDIIFAAIKKDASAIKYTDASLKSNRNFLINAIYINEIVFDYIDDSFKNNRNFVIDALKANGEALKCVNQKFKKDKEVVLTAIDYYEEVLKYADKSLLKNKKFMEEAIKVNPKILENLEKIDKTLLKNKKFILNLIYTNPNVLKYAPYSLKEDKDFILYACKEGGTKVCAYMFKYAAYSIKNDRNFIFNTCKNENHKICAQAFYSANNDIKKDKNFILKTCKIGSVVCGIIFGFCDNSLKKDKNFLFNIIKKDSIIFDFIDDSLKKSPEILYTKCATCHGDNGKEKALGVSAIIAGQSKDALIKKLLDYKAGKRNVNSLGSLMTKVLKDFNEEDIRNIANYLSKMKK